MVRALCGGRRCVQTKKVYVSLLFRIRDILHARGIRDGQHRSLRKHAEQLKSVASQDSRPLKEVAEDAIGVYLSMRLNEPILTEAQIARLTTSLAQADCGDLVSQDQVEAFFDDWEKEATAR